MSESHKIKYIISIYILRIITQVFSVTRSFRNHSNMMIWGERNISDYYQYWKQFIFWWKFFYLFEI